MILPSFNLNEKQLSRIPYSTINKFQKIDGRIETHEGIYKGLLIDVMHLGFFNSIQKETLFIQY